MSSRFDRAYRVGGTTRFDADFWNRIMRDLDTRIVGIEEKKVSFEDAEKTLLELGLKRINETLLPAAEKIFRVAELGFLVASSDEEATLVEGQNASLTIRAGDQRDLFTPSPFIALTRRSTTEDYAIARTIAYDPDGGVLLFDVETVVGNGGPHDDWDVAALAGSVMAMVAALDETRSLRQGVADDKEAVALMKAGTESARDTAIGAKDDAVIAKTGAENALTSFLTVYRGAHASAPSNGEQGHFYFDTTLQQARAYTAAGWAPLFSVSLGGIRQDNFEAEEGQTVFTVEGGGFTFINVFKNGVLLVPGVDYTTASPDFTLAAGAAEGDVIAYLAYYATEQTDFYTKEVADGRFVLTSGSFMGWGTPTLATYSGDLNDLEGNGIWAAGSSVLNRPPSLGSWCYVLQISRAGNRKTQLAMDAIGGSGGIATRELSGEGPTWSSWRTLVMDDDARLSDSREWTASTVSQSEAEAGTATTRRAWTAQRVKQAIEALAPSSPVGMYTGSSAGATTLPVGHHILVGEIDTGQSAAMANANGLVSGVIRAVNNQYQIRASGSGQLAGTWRGRGVGTQGEQSGSTIPITALMQRVA